MWPVLLLLLIAAAAMSCYLYCYLRRALETFGVNIKRTAVRIMTGCAVVLTEVLCLLFSGMGLIFLLHLLALALLLQAVNGILRRCCEPAPWWRKLYGSGILPVLLTAAVLLLGWYNMNHVVRTDYTVHTHKEIRAEGYRVALVADVHFGVSLDEAQLGEVCEEISAQQPDVVILCGDIVDNNTTAEGMRTVFRTLGGIESCYGVFYVFGNHDRPMELVKSPFTEAELIETIEGSGIAILQDEVLQLTEELVLAGREDSGFGRSDGRMSVEALLADTDPADFILTLDHQPREYKENGQAGTDLLLSGHTHGGQIWPVNLLDRIFGFNEGVYGQIQIDGDTQAIVTSGLAGWGFPVKTAAPAEYVMIHILNR